jgi:hypothetical protein
MIFSKIKFYLQKPVENTKMELIKEDNNAMENNNIFMQL